MGLFYSFKNEEVQLLTVTTDLIRRTWYLEAFTPY